jgi:hypothetical protein
MIFNNDNKKAKASVTPTSQLASEIHKKEFADRLKVIDKLIKDGNLDEAKDALDTVRAMDPKNGYLFALEERIEELREARDNPQSVELPKAGNEAAIKNEIELGAEPEYLKKLAEELHQVAKQLEAEYHDRIIEEISKGEERITEVLKQERERHDTERAALIVSFEKEKEKLLKELKKETRSLVDVEFKKADDSYQKLLANEIRKAEEKARIEISAVYEKAIVELKEVVTKEKTQLLDEERKAIIEATKKQTEDELQKRFVEELAKEKAALASNRKEHEEKERRMSHTDVEEKSEADLKHIERQIETRLSELARASEERYRRSIQEARDMLDKHLLGVKQNDPKSRMEIENKLADMQKEHAIELGIKTEEQLARERENLEKLREMEFMDIRNGVNWRDRPSKKKR